MGVNHVLYYVGGGSKFNVLNPFYAPFRFIYLQVYL